jgi:hypothetical protein
MTIENTDLERRVLAHERILQALIAHAAKAEPEVLANLRALFSDPTRLARPEHDFTDTASYAEQFIREVIRLSEAESTFRPVQPDDPNRASSDTAHAHRSSDAVETPTQFRITRRAGVWMVTKDRGHYGDYLTEEGAVAAAVAAVRELVSMGGKAEIHQVANLGKR